MQKYSKDSVLEASINRIEFIFDNFENIIVSISGGKDSTVVAYLMLLEAKKRKRKIGLYFLDEEVIYQSTNNQIEYLINLFPDNSYPLWYQIEFKLTNSTSLTEGQLISWENGKHKIWMRSKNEKSIKYRDWDKEEETIKNKSKGFGFYDAIDNIEKTHRNTCFILGIRAVESMNRWRAVAKNPLLINNKKIYWGSKKSNGNYNLYPIYDWNYFDIWKYIYDNKLKYSKIYDYQFKKGIGISEMRVSSLIHEKAFKSIVDLPEFEPKTYDKLLKRIKGISLAQETGKNSKLFRVRKLPKNYNSWLEYKNFLLKTYPDKLKKDIFIKRYSKQLNNEYVARQQCRQLILNDYENNLPVDNKNDPREEKLNYYRSVL